MIKGFVVVCMTYTLLAFFFLTVREMIYHKSSGMMEPYNSSNTLISENVDSSKVPVLGNTSYAKIFRLQNDVISLRREHHYKVAMAFFKNYSAVIVCLILISCIGGLLLFVLINHGWAASSFTIKVLFLSFASSAVCFSLFSGVFSQQKNFEDNMLRYMNYTKAEMTLARQMSELSKKDYPQKPISKATLDTLYHPAISPSKKDSTLIIDTLSYFNRLDSLVLKNNETINGFTDYILSIDAGKMRNIGEVYQSLMDLKNMGKPDSSKHVP